MIEAKNVTSELLYTIPEKNVSVYAITDVDKAVAVAVYAPDVSKDDYTLFSVPDAVKLNEMKLNEAVETVSDKRFVLLSKTEYARYRGGAETTDTGFGYITTSNFEFVDDAVKYSYDEIISMIAGIKAEPIKATQDEVVAMAANLTEDYVNLVFDSSVYQTYNLLITRSGKIILLGSSSSVYQSDSEFFDSIVSAQYATR